MSEAHLRMLVEKILVHEEDGRLDLEIRLKAPFRDHLDVFETGRRQMAPPPIFFDMSGLGGRFWGVFITGGWRGGARLPPPP